MLTHHRCYKMAEQNLSDVFFEYFKIIILEGLNFVTREFQEFQAISIGKSFYLDEQNYHSWECMQNIEDVTVGVVHS